MSDSELLRTAFDLAKAMHEVADEHLPEKLAGMVKLHAGIAAGTALIPIPGADIAAAATNIWTMYVRINKELNLPFAENAIKSIAAGVATNIGGAAAGLLVIGTAVKLFPGIGSIGGAALMAGTSYAITIVSGIVYMKAVTALLKRKSAGDISDADIREAAAREMRDKDALKEMMKDIRKNYKPGK
ncbi:MAG: hypothetical protein WDN24_13850 [Sphingomonas sp.]